MDILEKSRGEIRRLGVANLWLFGSLARGEAGSRDADFLVEFHTPPTLTGFMELKFFLEQVTGLPVDLHSRGTCPERFMRHIEQDLLHVA